MHLLAKASKFFHKPPTTGDHSAPPSKASPTGPSRNVPGLAINRRGRDPRSLRARPPAPTLFLGDIGNRFEDVHTCLERIEGLEFGDCTISATRRLSEQALDPVAKAVDILVADGQLKAACTLINMFKSEWVPSLLKRCTVDVVVLRECPDADVRRAMDRTLSLAGRHALRGQDISGFLRLLPLCSPETSASLQETFPPLTTEMVRALDEEMLVRAMDVAVGQNRKMDNLERRLDDVDALLTIAGKLKGPDLPRAVVMKCIVWESLGMGRVPDPEVVGRLKRLQDKTSLPAMTPALLERIPDVLKLAIPHVMREQTDMAEKFREGAYRLPATPYYELRGFHNALKAGELNRAAQLIHDSADAAFCHQASDELLAAVSQRLLSLAQEIEGNGAHAAKHDASVELEMAAVLAMTGEPSLTGNIESILSRVDSPPGQFAHVLLESLGYPAGGDPLGQMTEALPTLCDDHPLALKVVLNTDHGRKLVAQAMLHGLSKQRYGPPAVASVVMALAESSDLRPIFLEEIGQDKWISELKATAMMTAVIDLLKSGVPRGAEAAEKLLSLTEGSEAARESLRAQMRDLLPTLCDGDHVVERDFILRTKTGERLVAQAVDDYLVQRELDDATVSSLFTALAHRVDLRSTDTFSFDAPSSINNAWKSRQRWNALVNNLESVRLDADCAQRLNQSRPGWRLLALPCLKHGFFRATAIYGIFSAKAIDAAAADAGQGGVKEGMHSPALRYVIPQILGAMLTIQVADEPFLPDHALLNVMRAVVSDEALAEETLEWIAESKIDVSGRIKAFTAMGHALIELQQDCTPSRYDDSVPANHTVAAVATKMDKLFKGAEWWESFARGLLPVHCPDRWVPSAQADLPSRTSRNSANIITTVTDRPP